MKTIALAILLSTTTSAAAQCDCGTPATWQESFVSGDPVEATEVRQFVSFDGSLYAATGAWMDQGGDGGKGSASVIRLDAADGKWQREVDFGGTGTTTGALALLHFEASKNAQPVDVSVLVASTWSGANSYARNDTDHKWYKTSFGEGQLRAYGVHRDAVANEFWAFVGGKPGVYRGQLKDNRPAGSSPIEWVTTDVELNTVNQASSDLCSGGGRVTGFAEARGRLFASACWRVFVRQDGLKENCQFDQVRLNNKCEPRWVKFWDDPLSGSGESGLRGMTTVKHNGQEVLLIGSEVANAHVTRLDPDTAESVVEVNLDQMFDNYFGANSGYKICPYNSPMPLWWGPDGVGRRIVGCESWLPGKPTQEFSRKLVNESQLMLGDGVFLVRNGAGNFQIVKIPRVTPQPMTAVRDCVSSPFPAECNAKGQDCVLYCAGFDANKSTTQTPCYEAPCTIPPLVAKPTHRTGWIVKGRITVPNTATAAQDKSLVPDLGQDEQ
jgi:hypothetical protein